MAGWTLGPERDAQIRAAADAKSGAAFAARMKLSGIKRDPAHPYHNPSDPGHRAAAQEVMDLYLRAYPGVVTDG